MKVCHRCGTPWESSTPTPGVKETCEQCSAYLHCCLNCRFYDTSKPKQCYNHATVDYVKDKEAANFCDEFEFAEDANAAGSSKAGKSGREAFDALFGETPPADAQQPSDFDTLFGD